MAEARDERSRPFVWFAAAAALVLLAAMALLAVIFLGDGSPDARVEPSPAATAPGEWRLMREAALRAGPSESAREVVRATAGTPLRPVGRLDDARWLVVEVVGRQGAVGWVPATAVAGAERLETLPVVANPEQVPAVTAQGGTSGVTDLAVDRVFSSGNQLVVALGNAGDADIGSVITLTVNAGRSHQIDVRAKPLRAGASLEMALEGEYVQRRATVTVHASSSGPRDVDGSNNELAATVEPDRPNDLELTDMAMRPQLVVTVRNNSPIPIVGTVSLAVRTSQPSSQLLGRFEDLALNIANGATQEFSLDSLTGLDPTRTQVILTTSAINDADPTNDSFPR